jgi:hypothetical protein
MRAWTVTSSPLVGSSDGDLAGAALADQAETVGPRRQAERHAVDGAHAAEVDDEVLDLEQRRHRDAVAAPILGTAATRRFVYRAAGSPRTRAVGPSSTMRPSCITATRSHSSAITARS